MTRLIYLWHRRLALLLLLPILAFSLSGLLHPAMRLVRPEAAQMIYPPPVWPDNLPGFSDRLRQRLPQQLGGLRPVQLKEQWLLQAWTDGRQPASFYDPVTGQQQPDAASLYAIQLARHYSGDRHSPVSDVRHITRFGNGYSPTNRLLPVWRVSFQRDDQLQVFVDIRNDRLATLSDSTRMQLMQLFRWLHSWSFIDESAARHALFIALMAASTVMGGAGIWLFVRLPARKRNKTSVRQLHRWSGILISVALLMFTFSGLLRSIEKLNPEIRGPSLGQAVSPQQLGFDFRQLQQRYSGIRDIRLQWIDKRPVWQIIRPRQPDLWVDANTGIPVADGELRFASGLVNSLLPEHNRADSFISVTNYKTVPDYGFIDKRLPVIGLRYGAETLYVDTRDRTVSKRSTPQSRAFSWVFRYLHKWRFADGLGLNGRDGLLALVILMICGVSLLGLQIWLSKRGKRHRKNTPERQTTATDNGQICQQRHPVR